MRQVLVRGARVRLLTGDYMKPYFPLCCCVTNAGQMATETPALDQDQGRDWQVVTRKLYRSQWGRYFNWISQQAGTGKVMIYVTGVGDRPGRDALVLKRVGYDDVSDLLEVQTDAVDHWIWQPMRIYVDESAYSLSRLEVVLTNETRQIIQLTQPLNLPPTGP
jgi:hypothetical protein